MDKPRPSAVSLVFKRSVLQRWLVVAIVLVITLMAGYEIKHTPPEYLESANVVFSLPRSLAGSKAEILDNAVRDPSLIIAGDVMVQSFMTREYQHLIRDAGGTAVIDLAMVNTSDEEFPAYQYPIATLTAQSTSPVVAHRTFAIAFGVLTHLVLRQQILAAVPARRRMSISLVGDTGPVSQQGSLKRSFIALGFLAIVAVSTVFGWLERLHRRRACLPVPQPRQPEAAASRGLKRSTKSRTESDRAEAGRRPAQHRAPRKR